MVAKITSGVSVYGALYYNQEKVDKGKARTLAWNRIMERPDGTAGIPECMRSFEAYLAANLRTEKPVIHLSLNPHPGDRLSDGQLEAIGREYMEKLGYGDQPYIIFRHEDNARAHIHIVSLRIDEQGRKIRDYKEWERSMKICRELEQKYGLVPSTKEERKASGAMTAVEYRKGDLKHQIANVVRPALQDYRFRSFREFKALLGLFNVTVEEVRKGVDGRTCHGLVYAALDEKGYALYCYDFKYPDLSTIVYNHLLQNRDKYAGDVRFYVINFDDPRRSHRCNPINPAFMSDIADAYESAYVILLNLNKTWIQKQGDFFVESPIILLAAIIWYLKIFDGGRYCTFPHAIELLNKPYSDVFTILTSYRELENYLSPFMDA